jgi:hypothetical protein
MLWPFAMKVYGSDFLTAPEEWIPFISIALASPNSDKFHLSTG